jgi:hypothetical protein
MIAKFARLEFELFTKPSKLDFYKVIKVAGVPFYSERVRFKYTILISLDKDFILV